MRRYVIRRLIQAVLILFLLSIGLFGLIHAIPGGPERVFLAPHQTEAARKAIIHNLGLDQPLYVQYLRWLGGVLHGDLGISFTDNQPVASDIASRLPATLELGLASLLFALVVSIIFGVVAATRQYSLTDYTLTIISYIGISLPVFWFAIILQQIFGVQLHMLPVFGQSSPDTTGFTFFDHIVDYAVHLILPMIVLAILFIAGWTRYLRSSMLDTVKQDYVRTARAKGLSSRRIFFLHALRNALIPFITVVAIDFGGIASGALITETVFAWPGLGYFFYDALNDHNYPVLLALLLFAAVVVITFNLIADILYAVVDPRIRYS
ncbi:MAG TPA: ABC transporter permease [Ktedonobacterales bacterium]|nr:ABC transporter permease [Ktedonobacterales bacterium]